MSKAGSMYEELRERNGSSVVWWTKNKGWSFCIGDNLMNDLEGEGEKFEEYCEGDDNIHIYAPPDEVMNCVGVKDIDKLDDKHIEFLREWVGSNCYTREDW